MEKIIYLFVCLLLIMLSGCDSNPTEVNKKPELNTAHADIPTIIKGDSVFFDRDALNLDKNPSNSSFGCGFTSINFGTVGGSIGTTYTPYSLGVFISSYNSNVNATVNLNVFLDGNYIGGGFYSFQFNQDVALGTHVISVNAVTSCPDGSTQYDSSYESYTISLVPPSRPTAIYPVVENGYVPGICQDDNPITFHYAKNLPLRNSNYDFKNLRYEIQIDDPNDPYMDSTYAYNSPIVDETFPLQNSNLEDQYDEVNIPLLQHGFSIDHWHVRGINDAGNGPWSDDGNFNYHSGPYCH